MRRASRETRRSLLIVAVLVDLVLAATVVSILNQPANQAIDRSVAVTVAGGGVLDLGARGAVRIPPRSVDHDGTLHVRTSGSPPGGPDRLLAPLGVPLQISLDGAHLTAPATITLPVEPESSADPFTPVMMYADVDRWAAADATYDASAHQMTATTTHFSWWRAFDWDWAPFRDSVTGLVAGTFGTDTLAGAVAPSCPRQAEAAARARQQVTGTDNLLWCLDLDADGQLLLRVVNNRRMAVQVQESPGTELDSRALQPLSLQYLGPIVDQWAAARSGVRLVVLGPGEAAAFRVTDLGHQTGVGTAPSAAGYLTDVLDIGVGELSLMFGKLGAAPATAKEQLYRELFQGGELANCLSATLTGLPVLVDPTSASAIGRSIGTTVFGCLRDVAGGRVPALASDLAVGVGIVGSMTTTALRQLQDVLAGVEYLRDAATGQTHFFLTLAAPPAVGVTVRTTVPPPPTSAPPPTPVTTSAPPPVTTDPTTTPTTVSATTAPTTASMTEQQQVADRTLAVQGTQPWSDTGIDLPAGAYLYVVGSGSIKVAGSDPGKQTNGETVGAPVSGPCAASSTFTAPGLQCYGMVARIGDGAPFDVLASVSRTVDTPGRLYLGVNDDDFEDNSGAWQAAVRVCRSGTMGECVAR